MRLLIVLLLLLLGTGIGVWVITHRSQPQPPTASQLMVMYQHAVTRYQGAYLQTTAHWELSDLQAAGFIDAQQLQLTGEILVDEASYSLRVHRSVRPIGRLRHISNTSVSSVLRSLRFPPQVAIDASSATVRGNRTTWQVNSQRGDGTVTLLFNRRSRLLTSVRYRYPDWSTSVQYRYTTVAAPLSPGT